MHAPTLEPFSTLTIRLRPADAGRYLLGMHLHLPAKLIDSQPLLAEEVPVTIPWAELRAAAHDPAAYGGLLTAALFGAPEARTALAVARSHAEFEAHALHVGLDFSGCPPELHALRWELLQDPEPGQVGLGLSERVLLARRLAAREALPVGDRTRPAQSAIVAVASPADLPLFGFSPIAAATEIDRARDALRPLRITTIAQAEGSPCTVSHLLAQLRDGPDILCLIAHGRSVDGEVFLWLENEQGRSEPIASSQLAARITALGPAARPSLIIFATCESGGADHAGAPLRAVGPMLAGRGISAVLAIHGLLSFETNALFLPALLRELLRDGMIDRAVAAARGVVSDRSDWWAPILWLRPLHGRLWAAARAAPRPPDGDTPGGPATPTQHADERQERYDAVLDLIAAARYGDAIAQTEAVLARTPTSQEGALLLARLAEMAAASFAERLRAAKTLARLGDPRTPVAATAWRHELSRLEPAFGQGVWRDLSPPPYWRYVRPGRYTVGGWEAGQPGAMIAVPGFWIARLPITVEQLASYLGEQPPGERNSPATGVSWQQASAFCDWLTQEVRDALPPGHIVRLPTEAEWEVAAAYDTTMERHSYPWGEAEPTQSHAIYSPGRGRMPVGICPAGAASCGALDLAGNAWEMTTSAWGGYPQLSGRRETDFAHAQLPWRGGGWFSDGPSLRCRSRVKNQLVSAIFPDAYGFRLVLAAPDPAEG